MRLLLSAVALSLAATLPAQVQAKLTAKAGVAIAGQDVELELVVEVKETTELAARVLAGIDLQSTVEGKASSPVVQNVAGKVKVAAGTVIRRTLTVPMSKVLPKTELAGLVRVSFTWPGLPGASASLQVAPDPSGIDLAKLDYTKTRVMLITNHGNMTLSFRPDKAPNHVENFVKLAKQGFYSGTRFHRVMKGFMIQGGCPNTKEGAKDPPGTGNPGWNVDAEFNDTKHRRGTLSMARSADPNSAGSQFFVCHADAAHLDGQYTAFGKLEDGYEALDSIASTAVHAPTGGYPSTPVEPVHLYAAIVLPVLK